jgi:hypothetical protein
MKKILLFTLSLTAAVQIFSQSQRIVMIEEFTQASCYYCAVYNPGKCTYIKYQTSWPGYDPMNLHNPGEVATRVSYYGVNGVPDAIVSGTNIGSPGDVAQDMIDAAYALPASFNLMIQHRLSSASDSIYVTMLGQCTSAISGSLVAHIGVIEKNIHFNSPPGTNGERDFYNVMKKMLPNASGTALQNSFQPGEYFLIQGSWKLANVYSKSQLGVVGFIQNNANKQIQQGANSDTVPLTMPFNNDVQVVAASNYSVTNCSGNIAPMITIRNNGKNPVTSMTVNYSINAGTPVSYSFTGNMPTLKSATLQLPASTFTPAASDILKIYIDKVNDVADEYAKNDTLKLTISAAPVTTNYAILNLRTDNAPGETTWDVRNSNGTIIDSGGPYSLQNHVYKDTVHIDAVGCYILTINDSGGNGLCCSNGNGVYQLTSSTGAILKEGRYFGSADLSEFQMDWPTTVEPHEVYSMKVFPNPVIREAKVIFHLVSPETVILGLYNSTGQLVRSVNKGNFPAGDQECTLEAGNLQSGIYMLRMQAGSQVYICKVSVNNQ